MKKILLILICIYNFSPTVSYADTNAEIIEKYESILVTLEDKYTLLRFFSLLDKLDERINLYLQTWDISDRQADILARVKIINQNKRDFKAEIVVAWSSQNEIEQSIIESTERKKLQAITSWYTTDTFVDSFVEKWFRFITTNDKYEYVDKNTIKKLSFDTFLPVSEENYKSILTRDIFSSVGSLIIYNWEDYLIPQWDPDIIEKIAYSKAWDYFSGYIERDKNYFLEWDSYYTYEFNTYVFFQDKYWFYPDELTQNDINPTRTVLLSESWGFKIIKDFEKKKLISASLINSISDKGWFLSVVAKDARYSNASENDKAFTTLKNKTLSLTSNGSDQQKIASIYDYILDNHYYYEEFQDGKQDIFSWIDTFSNGYWVCDWYSKLMYYMLAFAEIDDIEHIRWYVIDAADFPEIGHAWVRIGDRYYDPTFDDPVWGTQTVSADNYRYFDLPKDLAYTNRLDWFNASDSLKAQSLEQRESIVEENLFALLNVYDMNEYNLLEPFQIRTELGIGAWDDLTIETLKNTLTYYEVGSDFRFTDENGAIKNIASLRYFKVENSNISSIINTLWSDFTDATLLYWKLETGEYEYRLAYELIIR